MPIRVRTALCLAAMALLATACRPADAPKEPTDPQEPQVSREVPAGTHLASVRVVAVLRIN